MLKNRITTVVLLFVAVVSATSDVRAGERRGSQRQPDSGDAVSGGKSQTPNPPTDCHQEERLAPQCKPTPTAMFNVCAGRPPEFIRCVR